VGNLVHVNFHESIETTLDLKERQKLELEDRNKLFKFGLIPDFEFASIFLEGILAILKGQKSV
jgi:hypothetical protein